MIFRHWNGKNATDKLSNAPSAVHNLLTLPKLRKISPVSGWEKLAKHLDINELTEEEKKQLPI